MGKYQDLSIQEVLQEINVSYFLPDIQREYVWLNREGDRKVEKLFDSLLRGFPIGSFLFWRLSKSDIETSMDSSLTDSSGKVNIQLYKFIEKYDERRMHNEKIDVVQINSSDLYVVLDGQQRLTSLYIGLRGSRTLRKTYGRWNNPTAFEEKKLYLNLRYQPIEENTEVVYQFEFLNSIQSSRKDEKNLWFPVSEIGNDSVYFRYGEECHFRGKEYDILSRLRQVIYERGVISFYEEREKNLDKVLQIFIRVNSGGTQLSYSDLLMSILTANFSSDIRVKMNEFVDSLRLSGFGCVSRDHVLKTCLLLTGCNHKFSLNNFNQNNIRKIEAEWDQITSSVLSAVKILIDFGYADKLSSGYIVSVIAMFLYRKQINRGDVARNTEEWSSMLRFVQLSQISRYFSSSLDGKLSRVVFAMQDVDTFSDFLTRMEEMKDDGSFRVSKDTVEEWLSYQYGNPAILPILQMLYPSIDCQHNTFHVDHIYPKAKFISSNTALDQGLLEEKNDLYNLQLLEGIMNISKGKTDPEEWLQENFSHDEERIQHYKRENYLDDRFVLSWENFSEFKKMRTEKIRRKLIEVLVD